MSGNRTAPTTRATMPPAGTADAPKAREADPRLAAAAALVVCLAAALPYWPTLHNYFAQDDFGVVQLLARKPASYFPRWFTTPWMDDIWGYIPDEIRPFPAVTYQVTALWGAASPVANHVLNIALHAANGLLVLAIARRAAGLGLLPAVFAALAFVLLPIQAESVAWITGRVDSMPAFFYLAAFLAYVRARAIEDGGGRASAVRTRYWGAVVLCFVALFSKQNTITLAPALVVYDALVARRPIRISWRWMRPYVPFALLTAGYLGLRYYVFGEIARESALNAQGLAYFGYLVKRHLTRLIFGDVTAGSSLHWIAVLVAALVIITIAVVWPARAARPSDAHEASAAGAPAAGDGGDDARGWWWRAAVYFGPVWLLLGIAPTLVANYESPRHIYLASVGWAIVLGIALQVSWRARASRIWRVAVMVAALAVLAGYTRQLHTVVGQWKRATTISHKAVADLERAMRLAPEGSLVIAGAPVESWEWSLPFAAQPPFTTHDFTTRVHLISPLRLHCCRSPWNGYTRGALQAWAARPDRPPIIALAWDRHTGALSQLTDRDEPFLRAFVPLLLETQTDLALDERLRELLDRAVAGR